METKNLDALVMEIGRTSGVVASEHAQYVAAHSAQVEAEAELLARAVDLVKPALRALASRIYRDWRTTSGDNGCNPVEIREDHEERGVCICDEFTRTKDSSGDSGSYGGARLYILTDGQLARVDRTGTWSCWQGAWDVEVTSLKVVTARQAVERFPIGEALEGLREALQGQLDGAKGKRTAVATARAARVRAVAQLLE